MNVNQDLLGKTITGVIATSSPEDGVREIWMLQFADGSHVEFVSPGARRDLRKGTKRGRTASLKSVSANSHPLPDQFKQRPVRRTRSAAEASAQLTLNVA